MSFPLRHLPVIQNWDCHQCGHCCKEMIVPVSEEERQRIEAQGWDKEPEFQDRPLFIKYGGWRSQKYGLNHREEDRCIFLSDQGWCRIHERFGAEAKPLACRLYPYVLVPVGDHWRVSLRYACPSAASNQGRPVNSQAGDLRELAELWEQSERWKPDSRPPPALQGRQQVSWEDLQHFVNTLLTLLGDRNDSMARRMLKCLALARICRTSKFDQITGNRLREFLGLLRIAVNAEVPRDLSRIPPPGWMGRMLFRATASFYIRKDHGPRRGVSRGGRLALIGPAWRFVRGSGPIPRLQLGLPEKTFEELEQPIGPLAPEAQEALERYYHVKVESLQFCGVTYFNAPFWEGFESLALTLPIILWLHRGYRDLGPAEAIARSISVVDDHFGFNPVLGSFRQRLAVRILAFRQELDRLIAWYAR